MATGTTEFIDVTTAAAHIPEIWSMFVQEAREEALVFAQLVNTRFEDDAAHGDTIHVQPRAHLAAASKSANTAVNFTTETPTNVDITIGTHSYVAIASEKIVDVQAHMDQMELYGPELAYGLALDIDDVLAGLVDNFSNTVGSLGDELTYENLLEARQVLDDANAPQDERSIMVSPKQEAGFLKLEQFVNADYEKIVGDASAAGPERAFVGAWMGIPIYKSTNVEGSNSAGHDNGMMQKDALALVRQLKAETVTWFDGDYLAQKTVSHQIYGTKEMRDDHGVWMKGA